MKFCRIAFLLCCLNTLFACGGNAQHTEELQAPAFEKGLQQQGAQVLDVRTSGEFQSGHVKNALQADWNNKSEFEYRIQGLDKSKPVYAYCLGGGRSSAAAEYLAKKGFTVYNLQGGITAWKRAGLPVNEPAAVEQLSMEAFNAMLPGDKTVLVDVGAEWCPPCRKMNPVIDSLAGANSGFTLLKIDGGAQTALSEQLKVEALPTFIIYKNKKEVWRKSGIVAAAELAAQL